MWVKESDPKAAEVLYGGNDICCDARGMYCCNKRAFRELVYKHQK